MELPALFDDDGGGLQLNFFYLADSSILNELNGSLKEENKSPIEAAQKLSAFKKKLFRCRKGVRSQYFAVFTFGQ